MNLDHHIITAIALGIALSACCGFRVFIPLLAAALGGYFHWIQLSPSMQWLGSLPAIFCFGTAALLEIGAYYLPFLDNLLDSLATPLAIAAGTLLATAIIPLPQNDPLLRWVLALLAGGSTAGCIQVGTGILRLFSTKATLGTGNSLLATGENAAAFTGSVVSFLIPVIMALVLLAVAGWFAWQGVRVLTGKRKPLP